MLVLSSVLMTAIGASFIPANSTKDMLEAKKKFEENTLVQIYVVEDGNDLRGLARFAPCNGKTSALELKGLRNAKSIHGVDEWYIFCLFYS